MANKKNELAESKYLFEEFGITEWHEKKIMLSDVEYETVIDNFKTRTCSPLVALVKLPFPLFAEVYINRMPKDTLKDDPALGYKLYLLSDDELREFMLHMRGQKRHRTYITDLLIKLKTPLEQFYRTAIGSSGYNQMTIDLKFIYITRYIDLKEAKLIGSSLLTMFINEGTNGYELKSKLALFNPIMRKIIEDKIGYYGGIRNQLELNPKFSQEIFNILKAIIPALESSLGVLKNKLEIKEPRLGDESGYKEYVNKSFREKDAYITAYYYYAMEPPEERALFWNTGNVNIYMMMHIFYKILNFSIEKVMDVLGVDRSTAIKGKEYFEKKKAKLEEEKKTKL